MRLQKLCNALVRPAFLEAKMSRTVFIPDEAAAVAFVALDNEWFEDSGWMHVLTDAVVAAFPSFKPAAGWVSEEGAVVARNRFSRLVIAEYRGLVSISIAPFDDAPAIASCWASRVEKKLRRIVSCVGHPMYPAARASNGETFYLAYSKTQL